MNGIWDTFEIAEVLKAADFLTCGSGGDSTEINTISQAESLPKRRSLYLPGNEECSVKGKPIVKKADVEENLILNRYAPKSRSILRKSIPDKRQEESNIGCGNDTETPLGDSNSSRGEVLRENDLHTYSDVQSTCQSQGTGHDRSQEVEKDVLPERRVFQPSYGNFILVVRRDVKNNTMAINFESKPS